MKHPLCFIFIAMFYLNLHAQNAVPQVHVVTAMANWTTKTLTIQYDLTDPENDAMTVSAEISLDNGLNYSATSQVVFSGDIGAGVMSGAGKLITADLSGLTVPNGAICRTRIIAEDGQPFDLQALVNEVDSNRLRSDLAFVEGIRHRTAGLAHLTAVKDSIKQLFNAEGIHVGTQDWAYGGNYMAQNILGTHRGIGESNKVVIVDAHYDTVINAPGADDNGSGVVGFMEISRLLTRYPAKKTLRFIGFDLEETGLLGSIRYVNNGGIPANETIEGVLNFEMIGYYSEQPSSQSLPTGFELLFPTVYNEVADHDFKGDFITNVGNSVSSSLVNLFKTSAATYVPELRVISIEVPGNGSIAPDLQRSDHAPFWATNKKALMLTDGANFRNECYHTPQDTAEGKLNFTFMSRVVKATLATAFQLAEVQHAGWGSAPFSSPVSVHDLGGCKPTVAVNNRSLWINTADCSWKNMQVTLLNSDGRMFLEKNIHQVDASLRLDLPNIPSGIYWLQMKGDSGIAVEKIVIP